mgnify:CR=1 FL=1
MPTYTASQLRTIAANSTSKATEIFNAHMEVMHAAAEAGEYSAPFPITPTSAVATALKALLEAQGYTVSGGTEENPSDWNLISWQLPG